MGHAFCAQLPVQRYHGALRSAHWRGPRKPPCPIASVSSLGWASAFVVALLAHGLACVCSCRVMRHSLICLFMRTHLILHSVRVSLMCNRSALRCCAHPIRPFSTSSSRGRTAHRPAPSSNATTGNRETARSLARLVCVSPRFAPAVGLGRILVVAENLALLGVGVTTVRGNASCLLIRCRPSEPSLH